MTFLKSQLKNNRFLMIVILAYVAVGIFAPDKFLPSLGNTWYYVKEMLMIMPVILLLTSLISAWVPKETIENAIAACDGNIPQAATLLELSPSTIYRKRLAWQST